MTRARQRLNPPILPPPPLSDPGLIVTEHHVENMIDGHAVGFLPIRAGDFIELTIKTKPHWKVLRANAKPLDFYNEFALTGKIRVPPFIKVQASTGRIVGHEGRHRAAALINEVGPDAEMWIGLILVNDEYYVIRNVRPEDVGRYLVGEFRPRIVVPIEPERIYPLR